MSTTMMTIRGLVIAAVLGLTSACATTTASEMPVPTSDASEEEAAEESQDEEHLVDSEDSYRLELECTRPGELRPC